MHINITKITERPQRKSCKKEKIYQSLSEEEKEKKSNNMGVSDIKISLKMKNSYSSTEKNMRHGKIKMFNK